jgi:putative endonuclease
MAKHNETGVKGEQIAENFLQNKGYTILHRNWCFGKKEVDIIALVNDTLVFTEVKTRKSYAFGFPEEFVNQQKQHYLKCAAEAFFDANPQYPNIRFDIVSVHMVRDEVKEIVHFEDAFY